MAGWDTGMVSQKDDREFGSVFVLHEYGVKDENIFALVCNSTGIPKVKYLGKSWFVMKIEPDKVGFSPTFWIGKVGENGEIYLKMVSDIGRGIRRIKRRGFDARYYEFKDGKGRWIE